MALLRLDPLALSRSRFALSPLAETLAAVTTLTKATADPWLAEWHAEHRPAFRAWTRRDRFAAGLVALVSSTKWLPAPLVVPPTGGMRTTLSSELPRVRSFDDAAVRAELTESKRRSWKRHDLSWARGSGLADRCAAVLERTWHEHVAPDWPRRRSALERDVMYRAGLLAAYGWPAAVERMSRHSAWVGADAIRFASYDSPERRVGADGMVFVPVTLAAGTWLAEWPPADFALVYPARGVAAGAGPEAEDANGADDADALGRLLGVGRARLLRELERPATSSELAAELRLSLGTVGAHLAALRGAALISGARVGRRVVYARTELGERLAGPTRPSDRGVS